MGSERGPRGERKVGALPNLTNMKVVYSEELLRPGELERVRRRIEELVVQAISRNGGSDPLLRTAEDVTDSSEITSGKPHQEQESDG
jgi:hypothetical protein